jgi:hypothetical protein
MDGVLSNFMCPICDELLLEPVALSCGHVFCRADIAAWMTSRAGQAAGSPVCPLCRRAIDVNPVTAGVCTCIANTISSLQAVKENATSLASAQHIQISRDEVTVSDVVLGTGRFGPVLRGVWLGETTVAIKTLHRSPEAVSFISCLPD